MNTSNIKKYAPVARKQFRDAVMQKLTTLGIEADKKGNLQIAQATDLGDSVRYGQFSLDKSLASRRERLVKRAEKQGYDVLVEHIAYTWFNRFCAIRYMELHGYLDHGFRMLSHPTLEGGFEVLDHVPEVADALGLDKARLVEMKLAGDRDEELYRELLLAQCHALHGAMPFLFEAVNDEIELVLPDNLTRTDSILRGLVDTIPDEDWEQVEVIGWLYQFYISEKKDDVIGKVVKSEDIPAATQLFTPNWIVQYLVQNSVGRQWLQIYPDSSLKGKMPYYIEPAEQTPEVQAQLAAITPSSIEPESIKVLDPACGSGHILTEAYNVLKAIYEERGYRTRDIPQLILENNIFGLDIDDRAAQLSGFAMLMLARQDDRRILSPGRGVRLNIVSLQESKLDIAEVWTKLNFHQQVQRGSMGDMFTQGTALANTDSAEYKLLMRTLALFTSAKTLGSLIQVPQEDEAALKAFLDGLYRLAIEGDIQQKEAATELIPYIQQAWILAQRYDAVVANPPYMGGKGMNGELKEFAEINFSKAKSDLFSLFIERSISFCHQNSILSMITPYVWMFIGSFEDLRKEILRRHSISTLIQLEYNAFAPACIPVAAFTLTQDSLREYKGTFIKLSDFKGVDSQSPKVLEAVGREKCSWKYIASNSLFDTLPGNPLLYWVSQELSKTFNYNNGFEKLGELCSPRKGMATGDNNKFVRYWNEVDFSRSSLNIDNEYSWVPYNNGGEYRKWYGNIDRFIYWKDDGFAIKNFKDENGKLRSRPQGLDLKFKEMLSWTSLSSTYLGVRYYPNGFISDQNGNFLVPNNRFENDIYFILGWLCSSTANRIVKMLNPTMHILVSNISNLPIPMDEVTIKEVCDITRRCIDISKTDWDKYESSWGFIRPAIITLQIDLKSAVLLEIKNCKSMVNELKRLEQRNNDIFALKFGVSDLLGYELTSDDITLNVKEVMLSTEIFSSKLITELLSYIVGTQMGRYSLDREGLVYAHEGNKGFSDLVEEGAYKTFPADEDGILPLMDSNWFDDDVTARVKEFVRTVWGEEHLQENLDFIAESLCLYAIKPKKGESSLDTIRRYLSTQFWKDHLKMYKKRPIYWLFSSGKEKAFECLVYLHRYNEGTLSRMRTEYVVPLLARYQGNIDLVNDQLKNAESGAATTRLKKELDGLSKKFNELRSFDDRLRHYADRRITIDLDDGVKVNYGKFGDLLADVKAITGSAPQEE